ncbi:hypothetical protein [Azospirillum agricola]|uniref:hypothetical protein n=1 Tax=Azospirillum agricola TaxID=1720247 RepID=UPI0011782786|nr:hypothetical protein [Azospirillum agricola]
MPNMVAEDFIEAVSWLSENAPDDATKEAFSTLIMKYMLSDIDIPSAIPLPEKRRGPRPLPNATWERRKKEAQRLEALCKEFGDSVGSTLRLRAKEELGSDATEGEIDARFNQLSVAHYAALRWEKR